MIVLTEAEFRGVTKALADITNRKEELAEACAKLEAHNRQLLADSAQPGGDATYVECPGGGLAERLTKRTEPNEAERLSAVLASVACVLDTDEEHVIEAAGDLKERERNLAANERAYAEELCLDEAEDEDILEQIELLKHEADLLSERQLEVRKLKEALAEFVKLVDEPAIARRERDKKWARRIAKYSRRVKETLL